MSNNRGGEGPRETDCKGTTIRASQDIATAEASAGEMRTTAVSCLVRTLQQRRECGKRVLFISGAGAQPLSLAGRLNLSNAAAISAFFGPYLQICRIAEAFAGHVTLNVLQPPMDLSTFCFHGNIVDNSVPEKVNTEQNVEAALARVGSGPLDVVFLGVGLTGKNGKGFKHFLSQLEVENAFVLDPAGLSHARMQWLKECGIVACQAIGDVDDFVDEALQAGIISGPARLPRTEDLRRMWESQDALTATYTDDDVVKSLYYQVMQASGWTIPESKHRRKRRRKAAPV